MSLPTDPNIYLTPLALITLVAALVQIRQNALELRKKKKQLDQKIYETLVLREIGERIGYELNVSKILDTIVDSLNKLLPYSVATYILVSEDHSKLDQRIQLEEPVNKEFMTTMTSYMLQTLNDMLGAKKFSTEDITENITGSIINESAAGTPNSLWLTKVLINNRGVGVLAIGSKTSGLYKGPEMDFLVKILTQANRALNNLETIISSERGKLESMVQSMADGVLMFDLNYNLMLLNPAASGLLELPTAPKPTIFEIAQVLSDKIDLRVKLEQAVKEDKLVASNNLVVGGKISQLLISPVKDHKDKLLGTVVIFHDKTAEKQLETLREDFTAMMVHELRAPLSVVSGTADMFIKDPKLAETDKGTMLLQTARNSVNSMLTLVNDLLDVAKIESGKFQILKAKTNLGVVVKDRADFFKNLANSKGITVETKIDDNLELAFDKDRISQVLNNLLSNAIKFTQSGGKIIVQGYEVDSKDGIRWQFEDSKIHADLIPIDHKYAVVSVSDTGQGIDEAKMSELFSKFKQLHRVEAGPGGSFGTGLGLIIAKGIVESHGGKMFVESHINEGSTFYLILPLDN